ncbi:hypothetical protein D7B24_001823 [Verticillium nonalfalfae]|uniref:DUF1772 domain-containing protein n=1 Tax=Verticillium nonalfalfae TaxID=1051616 RepID=A0A3M9YIN2_9PEZI|nr:uncharacterized protein D7B24_001823 [Verticillium nonalfalfae]RNJ59646.1 hypothetical protein D7B24_001823 [Verticillium nonalfalfae]
MSFHLSKESQTALLATTALASTTAAALNLSLSLILTPRLLELPTPLMLRAWQRAHARTEAPLPLSTLACGASYALLAHRTGSRALAAAAALCLSVLPWTRLLMRRRLDAEIARLADEANAARATQEVSAAQEASAKWLVDQWGVYNLGRGVPVLVAGAIGVFSLVL